MKELTEFDIFEALDRTSTIIKMTSELLGYVGLDEEENYLEEVHPAIEKHYAILRTVQDNLMELYQQLGRDLYEAEQTNALNVLIKISQEDIAKGKTYSVKEAIERMNLNRGITNVHQI